MSIQLGASIFPLTLVTQDIPGFSASDAFNQMLQLLSQQVQAAGGASGAFQASGFVNRFRNGNMDIWQRGTSITAATAGSYTADGWIVLPTGGTIVTTQSTSNPRTASLATYTMNLAGTSGVTACDVKQRLESFMAAQLEGNTCMFQCQLYNAGTTNITPTLTIKHASAVDGWTSPITDVSSATLQTCPVTTWTKLSFPFTASGTAGQGLEITLSLGTALNTTTKSIQLGEFDVRVGSQLWLPEVRPYALEFLLNARYMCSFGDVAGMLAAGYATSSTAFGLAIPFPVPMRIAPNTISLTSAGLVSVLTYAAVSTAAVSAMSFNSVNTSNRIGFLTGTCASGLTPSTPYIFSNNAALAANIQFLGAEL